MFDQPQEFRYDFAISFLAKDENIATQIEVEFAGRLKVFLYSKKQEQLAGKDGELAFNEVFAKQARLAVVLYRDGWGLSPWTRIEETAIRNRAFHEGWDFTVFINLDDGSRMPEWLPKNRIYVGWTRWGLPGASSVIEARVQERGGSPTIQSLEERAVKVQRQASYAARREEFMRGQGVPAMAQFVRQLFETAGNPDPRDSNRISRSCQRN